MKRLGIACCAIHDAQLWVCLGVTLWITNEIFVWQWHRDRSLFKRKTPVSLLRQRKWTECDDVYSQVSKANSKWLTFIFNQQKRSKGSNKVRSKVNKHLFPFNFEFKQDIKQRKNKQTENKNKPNKQSKITKTKLVNINGSEQKWNLTILSFNR